MSNVLPGTSPHITAHVQADPTPAAAWIEAHYEDLRGQWVAVCLEHPRLVASAPTVRQLWQIVPPAQLTGCLLQYVYTVEEEGQPVGPRWDG
jgi:hypothetical protein